MGLKWKNIIGYAAAPFTGGASLLMTDTAEKGWNDFTGKTATKAANEANMAEAEKNRQWQENMSNTAYQRQAQDLLNAGLNPVAATSLGGASTGTGAQAQIAPEPSDSQGLMNAASIAGTVAGGFSAIGAGVNQMAQAAKTSAETPYVPEAQKANIANTSADTIKKQSEAQNIDADTNLKKAQTRQLQQEFDILSREDQIQQETFYNRYQTAIANHEGDKYLAKIRNEWIQTDFGKKMIKAGFTLSQIGQIISPASEATTSAGKQIGAALTTRKIGFI